jgi:hypothetical protein
MAPGKQADRLQSIVHTTGGDELSSQGYGYDPAGRLTTIAQQATSVMPKAWNFGYNGSSELTSAHRRSTGPASPVPATVYDDKAWAYDPAGNWLSHASGTVVETRSHNALNQLKTVGGTGSTLVTGLVDEAARVTVAGQPASLSLQPGSSPLAYRFSKTVPVSTGSNTIPITATDAKGNATSQNWTFTVPAATRTFTYDLNGNTLTDGLRTFIWDTQNRLLSVTVLPGSFLPADTYTWAYDHRHRRISESKNGTVIKRFIWQENDLIQERAADGLTVTRSLLTGGFVDEAHFAGQFAGETVGFAQ